jgi:signal transduction histidine kinase
MKKLGYLLLIFLFFLPSLFAQTKESVNALIDKTMHFYETKKDSIKINAERIRSDARKLNLKQEELYYFRFMGFYYEYENKPDEALKSYLNLLSESERQKFVPEKYQALGDMVSVYFNQNQQIKAKELILKAINDAPKDKPKDMVLSTFLNNLGMIYAKEAKNDSALLMYKRSLVIKNKIGDPVPIADLKTNMASLYLRKGDYKMAEKLTQECYLVHKDKKMTEDLWFDLLNFANIYQASNDHEKALNNALEAEKIASGLKSKSKLIDTYEVLSNVYQNMGSFKQALEYEKKYRKIKDEFITQTNTEKIAELQEKYESEKKQRINTELTHNLNQETEKKLFYLTAFILSLLLMGILAFAFWKNKQKNQIIEDKNVQLLKLNTQKNHLISMVSHDLKTPFLSIKALANSVLFNKNNIGIDLIEDIIKSSQNGLELISKILESEKSNEKDLSLEKIELIKLVNDLIYDFKSLSSDKQINIKVLSDSKTYFLLTDEELLKSALKNVLSNAVKYSPTNSSIIIEIKNDLKEVILTITDQGPGIQTNNEPIEHSTGIGLKIVNRVLKELGGSFSIESSENNGTVAKFVLPKNLHL